MKQTDKKGIRILRGFTGTLTGFLCVLLVIITVATLVLSIMFSQTLCIFLGHDMYKTVGGEDIHYYEQEYSSQEELISYEEKICEQIVAEGIVLLKNEENTLPLKKAARISVFGQDSVDLVYGGTGAGSVDGAKAATLEQSLKRAGFEMNPVLLKFYQSGAGSTYRKQVKDAAGNGSFTVNEVPIEQYTDEVRESYQEYSDAAVVVLGRSGGESADLTENTNTEGTHYLELTKEEHDLLSEVCDNFQQVIVVLNSNNAMELGFINEFAVDACLWIGALGETGAYAVGDILNGTVNPSGRLVDTYAYDAFSSPAMANFGDYTITNTTVAAANKYMVYAEGIYVGYKYYETRYEDVVLGNEDSKQFEYGKQVQFPFGYGLSYTEFAWSDYQMIEKEDSFEISIMVTNTGSVSGKDVVEVYMQTPYTQYDVENKIEKASVSLAGFGKTKELEPGESQSITIAVAKEEMKSYDAYGMGTYIVDVGEYYLTAAKNAHDAVNNILSAKGRTVSDGMDNGGSPAFVSNYTQTDFDSITYAVSDSDSAIMNQFDNADIANYDAQFTYLSRSDWSGTWPALYQDGSWEMSAELIAETEIKNVSGTGAGTSAQGVTNEAYGVLSAVDLIGADYDDPRFEALLSQLSNQEMYDLVRLGGYATIPVKSINLPGTWAKDGPAGITSTLMGGASGLAYPPEVVIASTWNVQLAAEMGRLIGEDSIYLDVPIWYAPAMNIHRSPFSGRNFEYYSEDGFISGKMAAAEIQPAVEKGVIVMMKHFAVNDQECNRVGVLTFANEQSIREIYLKGFENSVREGNVNGVMTSMNRIGPVWSGAHKGLMTNVLREEWGFKGVAMTDQASFPVFGYSEINQGLAAGTDLWLNLNGMMWRQNADELSSDEKASIRTAAHRIIYAIVNSNAMNGISADTQIKDITPTWKYWRIGIVLLEILLVLAFAQFTRLLWFGKKATREARKEMNRQRKAEQNALKES